MVLHLSMPISNTSVIKQDHVSYLLKLNSRSFTLKSGAACAIAVTQMKSRRSQQSKSASAFKVKSK